jgi:hypothetical protein
VFLSAGYPCAVVETFVLRTTKVSRSRNTAELIPILGALSLPRRARPGNGPHSPGLASAVAGVLRVALFLLSVVAEAKYESGGGSGRSSLIHSGNDDPQNS